MKPNYKRKLNAIKIQILAPPKDISISVKLLKKKLIEIISRDPSDLVTDIKKLSTQKQLVSAPENTARQTKKMVDY